MTPRVPTTVPFAIVLLTSGAVNGAAWAWLGARSPLTVVLAVAVMFTLGCAWPVNHVTRPGLLLLPWLLLPALASLTAMPLTGALAGLALGAVVAWRWRGALSTAEGSPGPWLVLFAAGASGGPFGAVLLSPLVLDASGTWEELERTDVSRFQRIVVTRTTRGGTTLWLDGQCQLSTDRERSYHEALVRPALSHRPERVLILGGGDLFAARDVLRHDFVRSVTLVELDERVVEMTCGSSLGAHVAEVRGDARFRLVIDDALRFLDEARELFDAVIVDFPDPSMRTLAALFGTSTWQRIERRLAPAGVVSAQSCSLAFPSVVGHIAASVEAAQLSAQVHASDAGGFAQHAFVLAARAPLEASALELHQPAQTWSDAAAFRRACAPALSRDAWKPLALDQLIRAQTDHSRSQVWGARPLH